MNALVWFLLGGVFFVPTTIIISRQIAGRNYWRTVNEYVESPRKTMLQIETQLITSAKRLFEE